MPSFQKPEQSFVEKSRLLENFDASRFDVSLGRLIADSLGIKMVFRHENNIYNLAPGWGTDGSMNFGVITSGFHDEASAYSNFTFLCMEIREADERGDPQYSSRVDIACVAIIQSCFQSAVDINRLMRLSKLRNIF